MAHTLAAFGVVKLRGAWAAEPALVDPVVDALQGTYERLASKLAAKGLDADGNPQKKPAPIASLLEPDTKQSAGKSSKT